MKYIVRKSFWDYEKEEKWLNDMSKKGYSLIECGFFKYVFVDDEPSMYTYRIKLLGNKTEDEIYDSLQDGVELLTRNNRHIYYRMLTAKGDFNLVNDKESKKHYFEKRFTLFYCLMIMQIALGISNIVMALNLPIQSLLFSILLGGVMIVFGVAIAIGIVKPLHRKMKKLREDG